MADPFHPVAVTGMGVVCSVARSVEAFAEALEAGRCGVVALEEGVSVRPGVRVAAVVSEAARAETLEGLLAGEPDLYRHARRLLHGGPGSVILSLCPAIEALRDAGLAFPLSSELAARTGLIIAGNNLHHDVVAAAGRRFMQEGRVMPRYALTFFDTHQVGVLSELLGIRGPGMTVGAASASGNAAIFNALQWLRSGVVDRCLVVGASAGFSPMELEALALLGAASEGEDPLTACRPFDAGHSGFVWGEGSGALLLETTASASGRGAFSHGNLLGASLCLDAHHLPDPNVEGEAGAMRAALEDAGLSPAAIGYLNAHGSSSPLGDRTECAAIRAVFGEATPPVNATKSITGHCIGASGVIEAIATLLQLQRGFAHPTLNLCEPIDPAISFVTSVSRRMEGHYAVSNAFGFGGFNSSLVLGHPDF